MDIKILEKYILYIYNKKKKEIKKANSYIFEEEYVEERTERDIKNLLKMIEFNINSFDLGLLTKTVD